jgi:hypothetical protein
VAIVRLIGGHTLPRMVLPARKWDRKFPNFGPGKLEGLFSGRCVPLLGPGVSRVWDLRPGPLGVAVLKGSYLPA